MQSCIVESVCAAVFDPCKAGRSWDKYRWYCRLLCVLFNELLWNRTRGMPAEKGFALGPSDAVFFFASLSTLPQKRKWADLSSGGFGATALVSSSCLLCATFFGDTSICRGLSVCAHVWHIWMVWYLMQAGTLFRQETDAPQIK